MNEWNQFVDKLEIKLGKESVKKWIRSLKIIDFDAWNLYLEAKDSFQVFWFEEHVREWVKSQFRTSNDRPIKVHLTTPNGPHPLEKKSKWAKKKGGPLTSSEPISFVSDPLDPFATFENFFCSKKNEIPLQCLTQLSGERCDKMALGTFNPLYFCGTGSVGKTHLLTALTKKLRDKNYNVHYVHMQTFTQHVIDAIRLGKMQAFRSTYRHVDVLIVDDVHLLARKAATQEEFFHTFNALHSEGKQIVLASALAPTQLEDIAPRLVSRFEWGLVFPLTPIDETQKKEFVESRLRASNLQITPEIVTFLTRSFSSMKSLQMATDAISLRTEEKTITHIERAQELILDLIIAEQKKSLTTEKIIDAVAHYYNVQAEAILGKSHTKECAHPRKLSMYLCRKELKLPYLQIGKLFSRDHSTVMASIKGIEHRIKAQDTDLASALTHIQSRL